MISEPSFDLLHEDAIIASRRAPRDARRLPKLAWEAVRLVWRTSRTGTTATVAVQLVGAATAAFQVLLGGFIVREVIRGGAESVASSLILPVTALAVVLVVGGLSTSAGSQLGRLLGIKVQRSVTDDVLEVSTSVELVDYDRPTFHDQLNRVLTTMPTQPYSVVTSLASLVGGVAGMVALVVALFATAPLLVVLLLLGGVPLWFLSRRGGALEFEFAVQQTAGMRERSYITSLLTSRDDAAEVRAYRSAQVLRAKFGQSYDAFESASRALIRRRYVTSALAGLATAVTGVLALLVLVWLVHRRAVDVSQAAAAVLAIRLLSGRLSMLFSGVTTIFQSALFLDDFDAFRQRLSATSHSAHSSTPSAATGSASDPRAAAHVPVDVRLKRVSFTYPNSSQAALRDVSLEIPAGQVVAIVGENGSGKTTLAKLIAGLYEPAEGEITWTAERRRLSAAEAGGHTTLVLQNFARYQFTALENIAFGRPEHRANEELVRSAAEHASLAPLIDQLPDGYETRLSRQFRGGRELSLGQWQRVALARAFYRGGSLLILDEPAASLDPRAEATLYSSVRNLMHGCTVLLITHRLASVRGADRIVVMRDGELAEDGTHDELLAAAGIYAELTELQSRSGI